MAAKKMRKLLVKHVEPDVAWRRHDNDRKNWEAMRKLGETASGVPSIGLKGGTPETAEADAQIDMLDARLQAKFGAYKGDQRLGHARLSGGVPAIEEDDGLTVEMDTPPAV